MFAGIYKVLWGYRAALVLRELFMKRFHCVYKPVVRNDMLSVVTNDL